MIKFFRNIRQWLLQEGKTSNYLKYAVGEIVLVVIGILIALQINNWNQKRQSREQFVKILTTMKEDIKSDTSTMSYIIKVYDSIDDLSQKIINKEITSSNIDNCKKCKFLVGTYTPLVVQKTGFQQLQNFADNSLKESKKLTQIVKGYTTYIDVMSRIVTIIEETTKENFAYFRTQPWFIDWLQFKTSDNIRDYFGNSVDYRNRVAYHQLIAISNYQRNLKAYRDYLGDLLNVFDELIEEND